MNKKVKPMLYYSTGEEDRDVRTMMQVSGVPYESEGAIDSGPEEPTPYLEYGYWRYEGKGEIEKFIKAWKKDKLPPTDI